MRVDLEHLKSISRDGGDDTKTAASALEAYFLRQVLAEVRAAGGSLDGGFAGGTFREMLDSALADAMASSGGVGLARTIEGSLAKEPDLPAIAPETARIEPSLKFRR
ncbi:MAG: hypothetical protein EXR72_04010 [Myxococcales bacterium]|nr:hypothetical protein [Myxococcales bacterium]